MNLKPFIKIIFSGLFLAMVLSCSTSKNTFMHRGFHNMTARYNGYFYSREAIKEGANKLYKDHKDDYTRIIPVYRIGDESAAKNIFPEMDKAYKKSSTVIQRHSIFIRGTEYCSWIDDNYLLIGISHYFKRDYFAALEIFEYIIKQYKDEEIKYDAMVWMLRSYNEAAIVSKALLLIDLIQNDKKFPNRLKRDFHITLADFYLKQENYSQAIDALKKAIGKNKLEINKDNYKQYLSVDHSPELENKRQQKSRLMFILAQLYQKENDNLNASKLFAEVIKRNPDYEMVFKAKINQAMSYDASIKDNRNIKTQLNKMLKDAKNAEYFDQIYYALGEIAFKENDPPAGIAYLKKSVAASVSNPKQKAFSYVKLADYYFIMPDYPVSFAYYDSAISILPKDYIDYEKLENKKNNLSKAVKNINIINREDSLQRIARMGEKERNLFIDDLIEKLVKSEEQKQKLEKEKKLAQTTAGLSTDGSNTTGGGNDSWYFYNNTSLSMGFSEFTKKWGERILEDNWRRMNKETVVKPDTESVTEGATQDSSGIASDDKKIEELKNKDRYTNDLPLSIEKINKSTENIIDAYYTLGTVYKEDLNDFINSIKAFESLNTRFPENKYLLPVYYQLYRTNVQISNEARADYYKNLLLNNYPDSPYSKLIKNPDYAKEAIASKNEIENLYTETYQSYLKGQYELVLGNCKISSEQHPKNTLAPKFDLINAMTIGKTQGALEFENALKTIIIKHPKDEVKIKAQELLDYLSVNKPQVQKDSIKVDSIYKFDPKTIQHCVLLVPKTADINQLKLSITSFNETFFSTETLKLKNLLYDVDNQIMAISTFQDVKKAMVYLNSIKNETQISDLTGGSTYILLSETNLPVFLKEKKLDVYLDFFNKKYLGEN